VNHRLAWFWISFVILSVSTAANPPKGAFDYPTFRQDNEATGSHRSVNGLQYFTMRVFYPFRQFVPSIGGIREDHLDANGVVAIFQFTPQFSF
jgi:hypothetical protein